MDSDNNQERKVNKMKKRIRVLSLIMTFAVLLSSLVIAVPVGADGTNETDETDEEVKVISTNLNTNTDGRPWTDFADFPTEDDPTLFGGGSGTAEDPYQIKTAEQLALLAAWNSNPSTYDRVNTAFYILERDIDLAGHEWVAIGNLSGTDSRFMGGFDGNGHTISNLTVTEATTVNRHIGLFGYVGGANTIGNFTLTGSINIPNYTYSSSGDAAVSMVASRVSGFAHIENVDVYANINVTVGANISEIPVAGVVAMAANVVIENCTMYGSISVYNDKNIPLAGGISAWSSGGFSAIDCVNNADITIYGNNTNSIAGGIIAKCGRISTVDNSVQNPLDAAPVQFEKYASNMIRCINHGDITVNTTTGGKKPNNQRIGGIAGNVGRGSGNIYVNVNITQCVNTGKISLGSGVSLGGGSGCYKLVGYIEPFTVNNLTVTQPDGTKVKENRTFRGNIVISQCFVPYFYDNDPLSLVEPHFYSSGANINGEIVSGVRIASDCDVNLAIDVTETKTQAHIRISKNAVDALLAVGYELVLTYGTETVKIADAEELAAKIRRTEDKAYVIRLDLQADETPSLVAQKKQRTSLDKVHTIVAEWATWTDFYTQKLQANPSIDAEVYAVGSKQNPYLITNAGELAAFSEYVTKFGATGKYFSIINDIDLSAHEWAPAGRTQPGSPSYSNYTASGTISGHNHVIKNVRLTGSRYNYSQSFMGYSTFNLKDIVFDGITIRTPDQFHVDGTIKGVTGLISAMYGGSITNVHVKNLDMEYAVDSELGYYYGGFVGYMNGNSIKITDSSVSGKIDLFADTANILVGGMIARGKMGTVSGCVSDVDITVTADNHNTGKNLYVGGVMGIFEPDNEKETATVSNTANAGNLTINYKNGGGNLLVGGITASGTRANNGILNISGFTNAGKLAINHNGGSIAAKVEASAGVAYFANNILTIRDTVSVNGDEILGDKSASSTFAEGGNLVVNLNLKANNGASLALNQVGMAFGATFDQDAYEALVEAGYTVKFGMMILRSGKLDSFNGCVRLINDGVVKVAGTVGSGVYDSAIVNIKADLLDEETDLLSAVPYVTVTKGDLSFTAYGEASEGRSAKGLANAVLADEANYTPEQLEAVRTIYNIPVAE